MSMYKIEKTDVDTYVVRGPGLDGATPVWDHEADAVRCHIVLEHAYAAGLRARNVDMSATIDVLAPLRVAAQAREVLGIPTIHDVRAAKRASRRQP